MRFFCTFCVLDGRSFYFLGFLVSASSFPKLAEMISDYSFLFCDAIQYFQQLIFVGIPTLPSTLARPLFICWEYRCCPMVFRL